MKIFSLLNKDAKILYDTMKELQIPEDQLYLHDDESCPCGSGKAYKDCCKGKSDEGPVNSKKPVEVLLMEEMRNGFKRDKPQAVPATIHIENLHIHLDERMTSYNSFQSDDKPEDKEEEELPDIDVDEMLAQIKQNTGLCMKSILAVLEAEHKYLDSVWGTDGDSDEEDNA